jgi:hypothetical protein
MGRLIDPTRTIKIWAVLALLAWVTSCSDIHSRETLDAFASAYVGFHKAVYDSEISMWAVALDVSERPEHTGDQPISFYRQNFVKAFDATSTNGARAKSARLAVTAHDSSKALDDFEVRNDTCDNKSLALIEAANAIRGDEYRKQAVSLAETARGIPSTLATLRTDYDKIYDVQVDLSSALAASNGDMRSILTLMKQKVPEQNELLVETEKLRAQEQAAVKEMEGQYAAIKGATGITVDYTPPSDSGTK